MGSEDPGEAVLLEEHLREPLLDGAEVEERLGEDQGGRVWLHVEALFPEEVVPDGLLVVPVDQVAFLGGKKVEQGGEVPAVVDLVAHKSAPEVSNIISNIVCFCCPMSNLFSDFAFMMQLGIVLGSGWVEKPAWIANLQTIYFSLKTSKALFSLVLI